MAKYYEQIILMVSIVKWAILASLIGVITGFSTSVFLSLLNISSKGIQSFSWYFLLVPVALFLSALLVKYLAPDAQGHGTEKVIEAVHKRSGKINIAVVPVKLAATVITLAGGGSAGKEGPCAQIGGGLASGVADVLRLNPDDRKKIVICGISAGFATVFGTPLAGAIFAVEVLVLGRILNEYLFPALVAAIIGYETAVYLSNYLPMAMYYHANIAIIESLKTDLYFESMLSGIFFGIAALILIELLQTLEKLSEKLKWWKPLKGLAGGAVIIILTLIFGKYYLGLGMDSIENILNTGIVSVPLYGFLIKIIFTAITLSFGGSGGILTPIFFIGVTAGSAFATAFGLNVQLFAAIGLVSVLAAAANTPISATIMAIEMFGMDIAPYAGISAIISYIISGHRSVYPSQVIGSLKSKSISVPLLSEFRDVKTIKVANESSYIYKFVHSQRFKHKH